MYNELLQILQASPITYNPQITDLKAYGQGSFRVKMRAAVTETLALQIWLNHNPRHTRYSYQLFSFNRAVLRWDNAPHHPHLGANFPHHFHDDQGQIASSALQGDPLQDLPFVLREIERYFSTVPRP